MAMSASDYLNSAESQNDMAMKAHDPQRESLSLAAAQVVAIQAIAAAVEPASGCDRSHRWAAMSKGRRDREHDRDPGWTAALTKRRPRPPRSPAGRGLPSGSPRSAKPRRPGGHQRPSTKEAEFPVARSAKSSPASLPGRQQAS